MKKIGLIAGNGKLPLIFLNRCAESGYELFPVYLFDSVESDIKNHRNAIKYSVAQVGKIMKYFKSNDVTELIMLGKVEKDLIFSNLKFDLIATKILLSSRNKKDKNILLAIINYIESENIKVLPQNYLLDDLMTKDLNYTSTVPKDADIETIRVGIEASKMLTIIDAGQTAVVKDGSVISLEGVEGTDKTIQRAYDLAGKNCIIVKSARPKQDNRIDIPTIGLDTIKKIVEINAKGIVIGADKMLFLDQDEVISYANKNKIFIKGMKYD